MNEDHTYIHPGDETMRPEAAFWQQCRDKIPGHVTRVENAAGNGMPDINVVAFGKEYWIELKIAKPCGRVLVRKEQRVWMKYHLANGGKVVVLAKHGDSYYVFQRPDITEKYDERFQRIISEPVVFEELKNALDWIMTL